MGLVDGKYCYLAFVLSSWHPRQHDLSKRYLTFNQYQRLAAMSFDQYFENGEPEWLENDNVSEWYGIVEEALYAADLQSRRQRGQLELSLMKPLPMIPEDAVEESPVVVSSDATTRRPSSVYSSEVDFSHWPNPHAAETNVPKPYEGHESQNTGEVAIARRPSSVYSTDFDSPQSPESNALNYWASNICTVSDDRSMRSLRKKPFERQLSDSRSSNSDWSASVFSSNMERRSTASSIYSVNSSVYSYNSYVKNACTHARNISDGSMASSKKVRFEETALVSFFDLSDDEDEDTGGKEDDSDSSGGARAKSYSASKCLKAGRQLGKKALSLRIATSPKTTPTHAKASSMPANDVPALSAWLFRSSLLDRISTSPTNPGTGLEGQLMAGAAESAKARRVLGLK